jgi:hypothetical protein
MIVVDPGFVKLRCIPVHPIHRRARIFTEIRGRRGEWVDEVSGWGSYIWGG